MANPVSVTREIDARGSYCPGPLMELIRGLKTAVEGEVIAVISTDPGSKKDIPIWTQKSGNELITIEDMGEGAARFIVRKHVRK